MNARDRFGQTSITRATPSDHSPPMPSAAMNRSAAICQAALGEAAQAREDRVRQHAQRHRAHAADAVAQPTEQHAAGGRADQKAGRDDAKPQGRSCRIVGRGQQVLEGRPADQRKQPISTPSNIQPRERRSTPTSEPERSAVSPADAAASTGCSCRFMMWPSSLRYGRHVG